tara:strand:+ start:293 stop:571 length:279 start_codon:yes stop_codon:yes gene_type:complete
MSKDNRKTHSLICLTVILTILISFFLWQKSNFTKLDQEMNSQMQRANESTQSLNKLYSETFSQNRELKQKIEESEQTIKKLKFEISDLKQQK